MIWGQLSESHCSSSNTCPVFLQRLDITRWSGKRCLGSTESISRTTCGSGLAFTMGEGVEGVISLCGVKPKVPLRP